MRKHLIFQAVAFVGLAASGTCVVAQENRGTPEQQMACTPDVFRLCSSAIPDVNQITACLRSNTPVLSAGCRAVFEANNSAAPPPPRTVSPNVAQPVAPSPVRRSQYQ
jgi:hypothetical protein